MNTEPPDTIDGAKVVLYAIIGKTVHPTGRCRHTIVGDGPVRALGPAEALAICRYAAFGRTRKNRPTKAIYRAKWSSPLGRPEDGVHGTKVQLFSVEIRQFLFCSRLRLGEVRTRHPWNSDSLHAGPFV